MHGHRPPTPPSSLGPLCRIGGTSFWLVGIYAYTAPLYLLRNLWQVSGLWLTRFCISPQVALRDEILWQPDRGPDPTTSRFETESATTEPQKLAYKSGVYVLPAVLHIMFGTTIVIVTHFERFFSVFLFILFDLLIFWTDAEFLKYFSLYSLIFFLQQLKEPLKL